MSTSENAIYGESYTVHKFEQYKMFVEMADRISQRRMSTNTFFTTLNSLLITVFGLFSENFLKARWIIPFLGIIISIAWFLILKSYSNLNSAKFKVINNMEIDLPLKPYTEEWEILKNNKKYRSLTKIENIVPVVFLIVFIIIFLLHIPKSTIISLVNALYP